MNEGDLQKAMVALAEADTGGGGVATLIGKAKPLLEWGDPGMNDRPISTVQFPDAPLGQGSRDRLEILIQLDVFAEGGSGDLAERILDRYEDLLTWTNLNAQGVDAGIIWRGRRFLSELEEGGRRKILEGVAQFNR